MRKLVASVVVALSVAACTPSQVAQVMGHPGHVTKGDDKIAVAYSKHLDEGTSFLQLAAAVHNNPFLACTRGHESDTAGGYQAFNPAGPAWGAYQFLRNTWDNATRMAGFPQYVGALITSVQGWVQDRVALSLFQAEGKAPWMGLC